MGEVVRDAVRHGTTRPPASVPSPWHDSLPAWTLHRRDALARGGECTPGEEDPFGVTTHVLVIDVGIAAYSRDFDTTSRRSTTCMNAAQRLSHCRSRAYTSRGPRAGQLGSVTRRGGCAASPRDNRVRASHRVGAATRVRRFRCGAAAAAPMLEALGARNSSRLISAYALHADAKANDDGGRLLAVAEEMADIGALRYAVEAASQAAAGVRHGWARGFCTAGRRTRAGAPRSGSGR